MNKRLLGLGAVLLLAAIVVVALFLRSADIAILDPKGMIAAKQRDLMVTATLLMLIIVLPVFALTFGIVWRYRAGNTKAKYTPDWDHHRGLEILWWTLPCLIILVLSVMTWKSSHELDPFKPIVNGKEPITIQVVALQWKWLFIYPEQGIATVNDVHFPEDTPVNFVITADAPMNSFWIPQLGGQVYAMAGMSTKLHLIADEPGTFRGSSANISGAGFAGMTFQAESSTQADFDRWVRQVKATSANDLTLAEYIQLSKPSEYNKPVYYSTALSGLYDKVVMHYMSPTAELHGTRGTPAPGYGHHSHLPGNYSNTK